jgi:hypothetical protein
LKKAAHDAGTASPDLDAGCWPKIAQSGERFHTR